MSQHLVQTSGSAGHPLEVSGRRLIASHEQIASIVQSRLGAAHADLLAAPQPAQAGNIDWSTRLDGAVMPAAALPPEERLRLGQQAQRLLADIRGLAAQLQTEKAAASMVGQMLERVTRLPAGDWLYSVGGRPVLVMWGHGDTAEPSPPADAPKKPVQASAVEHVSVGAGRGVNDRGDWKRWLAASALLLALIALLLLGLQRCSQAQRQEDGHAAKIREAAAINESLEAEVAQARAEASRFMCVRAPEPKPEALAQAPTAVPEPPAVEPPRNAPYEALANKVAASAKDCKALAQLDAHEPLLRGAGPQAESLRRQVRHSIAQNCREPAIKEARNMCPGERPKELAPELALVFDASGSMAFSLNATDQEIQQMAGMGAMPPSMMKLLGLDADMERLKREPTRITSARQAALAAVRRAPSDANIGLVLVEQCPAARSAGFYPPARRNELLGGLQSIQPRQGTPLADGVAKAGALIDGVKREALMVVISDGKESCGQDPCAVAQALARAKPHLKINVVDILGTGAGNCLAQATNGRVFTARNADEVAAMTRRAAEELGPANCPKR